MNYPSIFNDVLGPVMRGPSSSHCAASLRIGRICRDLMDGKIENVLIEYDPMGSLATTHKSQGSDMGLFGGFLGYEADDERLVDYQKGIKAAGIQIKIEITDIQEPHPNTYKIHLFNASESHEVVALSLGGGMIEVIRMDGADVSMAGDFCETLIYTSQPDEIADYLTQTIEYDEIFIGRGHKPFVEVKSQTFLPEVIEQELIAMESVEAVKKLNPVLPVMSRKGL
ncbi:MAG: serine dehydratase, partial [Bacteroidetes bacterium]|nr:serine dehydratase [Bacteroidota bacterium]